MAPSAVNARKTHCPRGHEFNLENTNIYKGHRKCRKCAVVAQQKYLKRKREREQGSKREEAA